MSSASGSDSPKEDGSSGSASLLNAPSSDPSGPTVLVVGGGLAALCTAASLAAIGADVHVYEQAGGVPPHVDPGFALTEELQTFCARHGLVRGQGKRVCCCCWCSINRMLYAPITGRPWSITRLSAQPSALTPSYFLCCRAWELSTHVGARCCLMGTASRCRTHASKRTRAVRRCGGEGAPHGWHRA